MEPNSDEDINLATLAPTLPSTSDEVTNKKKEKSFHYTINFFFSQIIYLLDQ